MPDVAFGDRLRADVGDLVVGAHVAGQHLWSTKALVQPVYIDPVCAVDMPEFGGSTFRQDLDDRLIVFRNDEPDGGELGAPLEEGFNRIECSDSQVAGRNVLVGTSHLGVNVAGIATFQ